MRNEGDTGAQGGRTEVARGKTCQAPLKAVDSFQRIITSYWKQGSDTIGCAVLEITSSHGNNVVGR